MTKQSPGELALVYLQDMLPEAAVAKFELLKHDILTVQQMRDFYKKIIAEEKSNKRRKAKGAGGLHELVERLQLAENDAAEKSPEEEEEEPAADNMLYSLLSYAKDSDVAKVLSPQELLTFVRWKTKGGGKGGSGGKGGKGKGGPPAGRQYGPPGTGSGAGAPAAPGTPFAGRCNHCNMEGHRKSECPELDKIMNARRAAGMGGGNKGNGKGYGGGGYNGSKGSGKGGGGAYAMPDMFSFIDRPQQGPGNGGQPASNPTQWGGRLAALFTVTPESKVEPVPIPSPEWTRPRRMPASGKTFESPNVFSALRSEDPEPRAKLQLKEEFAMCACEDPRCTEEPPEGSKEPSKRALKRTRRKQNVSARIAERKEDHSESPVPPDLGDSDDEEDVPEVEDSRLSAKQLERRLRRREMEGYNRVGLPRSDEGLPPFAEDDRQTVAEETSQESMRRPVESKPWFTPTEVLNMSKEVDERLDQIKLQRKEEAAGRRPIGVVAMKDLAESKRVSWNESVEDQEMAVAEGRAAGIHMLTEGQQAQAPVGRDLCAAWSSEQNGWRKIRVVMDSGAAECVAPRDMAPQYRIADSIASRSGVFYTSADGGRLDNLGQQELPIAFDNGTRAMATFQIANVSRPLMSVARICELGNRVLFGASGGVILNLESGQVTPFEKEDGVYVFSMWIPPLSESPFGRPR